MSRYISVDDMRGIFCQSNTLTQAWNGFDMAPSIDIVHCINCEFCSERGGHANCNGYLYCTRQKMLVDEACFCSWGKEK